MAPLLPLLLAGCAAARRTMELSASALAEHSVRLAADAFPNLRTCEALPR